MPFNLRFAIFIVACVLAFTVMRILHKDMIPYYGGLRLLF